MEEFRKKRKLESENLFSKKYKVTSEMSTPSFNENNNEINDHDHSIIDSVNDDCLAEIFMYVPTWERSKIALVCQKWKRVLEFSWGNVKKLQITHWEYNKYPNCLNNYTTPARKLRFLKSLLKKCGCYLTQLDLTAYSHMNIVPVINDYCPNLVKLRLRFIDDNQKLRRDAFSCLSKLKVLAVIFQYIVKHPSKLYYIINALEPLAKTLTDLALFNWKADVPYTYSRRNIPCTFPGNTVHVLRQLKALKRFEFGGILIFPELGEYLRDNRTLECSDKDRRIVKDVITPNHLTSITTLDFLKYKVSDDILYTITNTMKRLTTLKINCEWTTNDGVVAISKMNNLKDLRLSGRNSSIDSSSIKLLKNLIKLLLPSSNKITDDLAMKVLENSPKMNMLVVLNTSVTDKFIKKAAEISKNRKQLLTLGVSSITHEKQYESEYFKIIIFLIKERR